MLKGQADKKKKFIWINDPQFAFDSLREGLIQSMGLVIPDLNGQFVIECDAIMKFSHSHSPVVFGNTTTA